MSNKLTFLTSGILLSLFLASCQGPARGQEAGQARYVVYPDSVVQGSYVARVASPTEIASTYQSPANAFVSPRISFKFSINGKDNEMVSGKDHYFNCLAENGRCETPLIKFGEQHNDSSIPPETYLAPATDLKIRLDMRHVLKAFKEQGYYETFKGEKIYQEDFKGVFVAGGTDPLIWDFDNLASHPELQLHDQDGDGIFELSLPMNSSGDEKLTASQWKLSRDISTLPQYSSNYPLIDALYNMSLEEMLKNIEGDRTFRTGAEWGGVWTRDISYSLILSMASLEPEVSKNSLMRKVKNGLIVQDTGTGGAYPASTDRIVWAIAAWEVYKVTGEQPWLQDIYRIIRNTVEQDLLIAYDERTGLVRGESSFLDWREQTYPEWMEPADIYESLNLGTNAVHYQSNVILAAMAGELGEDQAAEKHRQLAETIKKGINDHLWIEEKGYYGQFLYGSNFPLLSPRSEALGEALCVLFDIAEPARQKTIVESTPLNEFGIPCIYPQIPNIPPYHNNGIWPFVQAYWSLAAAKAGNEEALTESLRAIYRPAALFLTNKENFVASSGDYVGTQINSDRQLWSVAGMLGMVYKVFYGMDFQPDQLVFRPFVPEEFKGNRKLRNFKYRNAVFNIEMEGYGNEISSFSLDGEAQLTTSIPAGLTGEHDIKIVLANNKPAGGGMNMRLHHVSPITPVLAYADNRLQWGAQQGVKEYQVLKNGEKFTTTAGTSLEITASEYAEFQLIAIDEQGYESFASEPLAIGIDKASLTYEFEELAASNTRMAKGYSGSGFVELSSRRNTSIKMEIQTPESGLYAIDFRYANGNGPVNTDNKCAIRSLKRDNEHLGAVIMPQRGTDEWSNWGYSNTVLVQLEAGAHTLSLILEEANRNMDGEVNQALVDYMRLTKIR